MLLRQALKFVSVEIESTSQSWLCNQKWRQKHRQNSWTSAAAIKSAAKSVAKSGRTSASKNASEGWSIDVEVTLS